MLLTFILPCSSITTRCILNHCWRKCPWRHTAGLWGELLLHPTYAGVVIPSTILKTLLWAFFMKNFVPQFSTIRPNLNQPFKEKVAQPFCCVRPLRFCFTDSLLMDLSISMHFRQKINPYITVNWKLFCYPKTVSPILNTLAKVNTYFLTNINQIQEWKLLKWCLRNQGTYQTPATIKRRQTICSCWKQPNHAACPLFWLFKWAFLVL